MFLSSRLRSGFESIRPFIYFAGVNPTFGEPGFRREYLSLAAVAKSDVGGLEKPEIDSENQARKNRRFGNRRFFFIL